jgi:CBS domain-containing protein
MKVQELMTRGAECVAPNTTLQDAARRMKDLDVGSLPICDNDRLAGMVTDRDMVIRGLADGSDPTTTTVDRVMSPDITYCFEDQDVEEASRLMKDRQIRRLAVLNRDKRLVGMLSLGDLSRSPDARGQAEETLEEVSRP